MAQWRWRCDFPCCFSAYILFFFSTFTINVTNFCNAWSFLDACRLSFVGLGLRFIGDFTYSARE